MGITSKLFLVALGLLALAGCGLTVWLWPKLAGRGARPVAGRIGLLLSAQVALLITVAVLTNDLFGFYTSWSDLFGVGSQHYQLKDSGGVQPSVNAGQLQGGTTATPASQASPNPGAQPKATMVSTTLVGLRSGITAGLQVFLPPEYYAPTDGRRYYPAIVVDDTSDPGVATLASDLMSGKQRPPQAVVVIVREDHHRHIPCVTEPNAASAEQFWGQDLRTAVADSYRVRLSAAAWGVMGGGPGGDGDCAVALALQDAGRYSAAAVFGHWQPFGAPDSPADPAWWLRNYPAPPSRLLFAATGEPPQAILGPVRPPLQVMSTPGPTTESQTLDWLAQTLQNGAPQS